MINGDEEPLVVDLRGQAIGTWGDLWAALTGPCQLPADLTALAPDAALDAWIAHIDPQRRGLLDRQAGIASAGPIPPSDGPHLVLLVSAIGFFARGNPDLRQQSGFARTNVGGRDGVTTQLSNVSEVTGQAEYITMSTTYLRNGSLLYMIGVAPRDEANTYDRAFQRVRQQLELQDR